MIYRVRFAVQAAFLVMILAGVFLFHNNVEAWCPFGGVEALYTYFHEGNLPCSLGISNFYSLGAVLLVTLLFRNVFCSYFCPIGSISEWLGRLMSRLGRSPVIVPRRLDRVLSLLKFPVLLLILFYTYRASELLFRSFDPCYALISRHGEDITFWSYVVSGAIIIGSLFVSIPFCRWLCPLAAILNPLSRFGLARIKRNPDGCIDCGKCAVACKVDIPVDEVGQVTATQCSSCGDCIDACPVEDNQALVWGPSSAFSRRWSQKILLISLGLIIAVAVIIPTLFPNPSYIYERGERPAEIAVLDVEITPLTCRGKCSMLTLFLERDDEFLISGYLKLEAWPAPSSGRIKVSFDPAHNSVDIVKQAITVAYYDMLEDKWWISPFELSVSDPAGN